MPQLKFSLKIWNLFIIVLTVLDNIRLGWPEPFGPLLATPLNS